MLGCEYKGDWREPEVKGSVRSQEMGVDDIGEMGEQSRTGLCRDGSCHALGWKGLVLMIGPKLECGRWPAYSQGKCGPRREEQ